MQARLIELWNAGKTSTQICREPEFRGFTRNAVIGQLWRLRKRYPERFLPERLPAAIKPKSRRVRGNRRKWCMKGFSMGEFGSKRARTGPVVIALPVGLTGTPLLELPPNGCRFIVSSSDGRVPTHLYCGQPAMTRAPGDPPPDCYCAYHQGRMRSRG